MSRRLFFLSIILLLSATTASAYLPSDPLYFQQSYLDSINIRQAWDIARGDGVVVAVMDSGVDINHPDLEFNIWRNHDEIAGDGEDNDHNGYVDDYRGWDFVDDDSDASPVINSGEAENYDELAVSHGTALAGIIGAVANNGQGMAGIAFNAKIMPLRILTSDGQGYVSNLIKAIDYAVKNGADIINLSLVGLDYSDNLKTALERAYRNGVVIVAAAGNAEAGQAPSNLDEAPTYPACYGDNVNDNIVVAVTSLDAKSRKSSFANYGANCIDLAARGQGVNSLAYYNPAAGFNNHYSYNWSGTSFSTAIVSGVAALVKSRDLALSANEVIDLLRQNVDNIDLLNPDWSGQIGAGQVDAFKVLSANLPNGGKLIKLANDSAVYFLDESRRRHLFSNEKVFWSWYSGSWEEQLIEIVSQEQFDYYPVAANITIRPGTKLIKFQNSNRVYAVLPGGLINYLPPEALVKLYGDYQSRLVTIQNSFESDYLRGETLSGDRYPDGSLLQYQNSADIWLIDKGEQRKFAADAFVANGFKTEDVINDVSESFSFAAGRTIDDLEKNIFVYRY